MAPPLKGITILDLSRLLPGPYATLLLADMGAEVIKVEEPGQGDYSRWDDPKVGGVGATFLALNRSKKSITLNLKAPEGKEAFRRLAQRADGILEGFRPGVMDRLGLGYRAIREINPRIVYCALTGYGQDGPYRDRVGHDINYIAYGGVLGITGERDGSPIPPGVQVGDLSGGMLAALAMVIGLFHRERAGEGCYLDIAMLDGIVSWLTIHAATFFAAGQVPRRGAMRLSGGLPGYHVYETKDGRHVTVGALEEKFWRNLCRALGCEDLAAEPAPTGQALEDAEARLRRIFRERTRAEWVALLGEAEVCFAPVLDLDEALTDPQVLHRRMVVEMEDPEAGKVRQLGNPIKSSLEDRKVSRAPRLGEHTGEILQGLGYSREEVERLRREGIVGG